MKETQPTEIEKSVDAYRAQLSKYQAFAARMEKLLGDLLGNQGVKVQFIESRAKSPKSLGDKLRRPEKSYSNPLVDVSDLVGIRVVLYYHDDVQEVGKLVEREFTVIEKEEAHQSDGYSPDQFGYLSMHYVVGLSEARAQLAEWKEFASLKAEIQVRTVLQHSWAAVSHALQYKRKGDVPFDLRRKLYRLAGLFELADEQFVEIRKAGDTITKQTRKDVREAKKDVRIDAPALREMFDTSPRFKALVATMEGMGYEFLNNDAFAGEVVEECERLGIYTLEDLDSLLSRDNDAFLSEHIPLMNGVLILNNWFALLLVLANTHSERYSVERFVNMGWARQTAKMLLEAAGRHTEPK